jgi:hypothetical protein
MPSECERNALSPCVVMSPPTGLSPFVGLILPLELALSDHPVDHTIAFMTNLQRLISALASTTRPQETCIVGPRATSNKHAHEIEAFTFSMWGIKEVSKRRVTSPLVETLLKCRDVPKSLRDIEWRTGKHTELMPGGPVRIVRRAGNEPRPAHGASFREVDSCHVTLCVGYSKKVGINRREQFLMANSDRAARIRSVDFGCPQLYRSILSCPCLE